MLDKFPILAWPTEAVSEKTIEEVKLWKEIGLTANITGRWNEEIHDKSLMLRLLDECEKYDIKVFVSDTRTLWNGASTDPDGYRARFRAAYKDFGKHPAVLGFYVGDEPLKKHIEDVISAMKIQMEEAPELTPFLNLLPIWSDSNPPYMGYETLENYVRYMKENYNAPILSYDRYTQMCGTEIGNEIYFHDMRIYNDISQSLGVPMWTCLLSAGHWEYKAPTEEEVRWQFNTALAGGCTGIIWFTINDIPFVANFHGTPIDMFGNPTPRFYNYSVLHKKFLASTADVFKDLKLDECYHVGHSYGGYPLFKEGDSDFILDIRSLKDTDMILSFFTHKSGDKYVAVVNNSKTVNDQNFNITFNRKKCDPYEIRGEGIGRSVYATYPNKDTHNFDPRRENNTELNDRERYTVNLWACAGQMYLFKL